MGVFGAMTTALSGLRSQSYALENISGNIANSRTAGFKRVDTNFIDLIPDTPQNRELAGSVLARSLATNSVQGDIASTTIDTNIAINGDGFFVVAERQNTVNGLPTFSQNNLYTRRGDFDFDANGYLVNGAGYYLKGIAYDPITGSATSSNADVIRKPTTSLPPRATTQIEYAATLPATPQTTAWRTAGGTAGSELLGPATNFPASPPALNTIAASDNATFEARTIPGGTITGYDSLGRAATVRLAWAKTSSAPHNWNLYVQSDPAATGAAAMWTRFDGTPAAPDFTFSPAGGGLTARPAGTLPSVTVNGVTIAGINLVTSSTSGSLTQVQSAGTAGQLETSAVSQDGYSAGVLERTSVSEDGRLVGTYSNGRVATLAQLTLARFASPNSLKRMDGGAFAETTESGLALVGTSGSSLVGGSVEQSNTDIADEFSKMIVTQQAYSANTRVITTSQQMLSDILNIVR